MMTSAPTKGRNTARLKTQVSNPVTSTVLLLYDDHEDYGQHCCRSEEQLAVVLYFSGLHGAKTLSRRVSATGGRIDGPVNCALVDPLIYPSTGVSRRFTRSVNGAIKNILVKTICPPCERTFHSFYDYIVVKMI